MTSRTDKPWWWVKGRLEDLGVPLDQIARDLKVDKALVSRTRYRQTPKVQAAIAAKLGLAPWDIWPTRYTHGRPVRPVIWEKANTARLKRHRQKGRAA